MKDYELALLKNMSKLVKEYLNDGHIIKQSGSFGTPIVELYNINNECQTYFRIILEEDLNLRGNDGKINFMIKGLYLRVYELEIGQTFPSEPPIYNKEYYIYKNKKIYRTYNDALINN